MLKGFKNFLMRDDVVTVAIGLVVALAFSNLVKAFTDSVINPLVAAAQPDTGTLGLGWQLKPHCDDVEVCKTTFLDVGTFISAIIYFAVFMMVVYFAIVLPYKQIQARRGVTVFGEEPPAPPTKTCPECLSDDLPMEARKCLHCGSLQVTSPDRFSAG
jgi:large conductance mechanosensitive channel